MRGTTLHLLLPFSLPDDASLWQALAVPALSRLLARARLGEALNGEDYQRALGHERWLAERYGLDNAVSAPFAPYMLLDDGGTAQPGSRWACIEPVHIEVAHDHLSLVHPAALALDAQEARALFEAALPSFEAAGLAVQPAAPGRWYLSAPAESALARLVAASPDKAAGRSVDLWLPHDSADGKRARAWMRLQNEIQMVWHDHAVNAQRAARRAPSVNSVWLHGLGEMRALARPFDAVRAAQAATRGLGRASGATVDAAPSDYAALDASLPDAAGSVLVECDDARAPTLAQDAYGWREAMVALEARWFAPALEALAAGQLGGLELILAGDTQSRAFHIGRGDLRRFWRRRTLASSVGAA